LGQSEFTELVRRYIGIFLKAPVVEDLDYRVAHILGIASGRKKHIEHDRIAYVVDPECVVRLILYNHLKPTVEHAILQLTTALDNLQRNIDPLVSIELPLETAGILKNNEQSDLIDNYKPKPAYFRRDKINPN
jgi:alkyl hydroperoxide reductase subunit AhpC